jgi:excisionase family DNA binding protein
MTPETRDLIRAVMEAPERAAEIPPAQVPALLAALAGVQLTLAARLVVGANGHAAPMSSGPDRNLDIQEAARILGVSRGYLYRHAESLPFTVRIGRRLLFSAEGLERWNRRRQGR